MVFVSNYDAEDATGIHAKHSISDDHPILWQFSVCKEFIQNGKENKTVSAHLMRPIWPPFLFFGLSFFRQSMGDFLISWRFEQCISETLFSTSRIKWTQIEYNRKNPLEKSAKSS